MPAHQDSSLSAADVAPRDFSLPESADEVRRIKAFCDTTTRTPLSREGAFQDNAICKTSQDMHAHTTFSSVRW